MPERRNRLGKRERAARKRHRRTVHYSFEHGSEAETYKLGRKKLRIQLRRLLSTNGG